MKCQILLLALAGFVSAQKDDRTPTERVVNMLQDLKGKIVSDGKAEEQIYNKYACWCETTTKRKAGDITTAENDLRSLGQMILKLKGKVATRTAEIKELEEKLEQNQDEQDEATSMREKNNAKFMADSAEKKQAIAALAKAVQVLQEGSGTKLLQTDSAVRATSAVQAVIDNLPEVAPLDSAQMAHLNAFVQNGAAVDASYAPQSATIQGILTDMYATFASDVEEATMTEAKQNADYEKLIATLQQEAIDMKKVKSRKEEEKADAESDLADTTATYDDTQEQMKADIKFFDETRDACDAKHEEWSKRKELRDDELKGVEKALEFLTSDEARDLFASAIKPGVEAASFLQIDSDNAQAATLKVYEILKAQATKSKSLRLASLAVRARTTKFGHFDQVIKAIDGMINTLNEEGAADKAKKDQCNEEYQKIALTVQDLDWKIKNNEAKIEKLENLIDLRNEEREETIQQMDETNDHMKQITDDRKAEHEEFQNAQADDKAAIELLNKAKDALTAFYKKNKIEMLQADPAFAVSEDQAPEAKFSDKGNRKGMSKGIVAMMDYIIQDLEDEFTNDGKSEAKSQEEYENEMKTAQDLLDKLDAKKKSLEDMIAKRQQERTEEKKDMAENDKDREAELKYEHKIKPDCDWILKNFDGRANARAAEMDGLTSAKEFLAGKVELLQVKKMAPVQEHATGLASIKFLGIQ